MIVRRYKGKSLETLREVVVKEMGENAVIIHSNKIGKGGLLGGMKKQAYEVVAAVEDALSAEDSHSPFSKVTDLMEDQKSHYRGLRMSIKMMDQKLADLEERLQEMPAPTTVNQGSQTIPELANIHPEWQPLVQKAAEKIADNKQISKEDWHEALASKIPSAGGILFRQTPGSLPDVYAFVGPTGVGKTTTLAKLAAKAVLNHKLNLGLITIDTFRIAAVDQLREYAALLGVEMAVCFNSDELQDQLRKFADKDVVLIDTQGRGPLDTEGIGLIQKTLAPIEGLSVILHAQASIRQEDAVQLVKSFKCLNPSCLVLTKSDEASRCDGLTRLFDLISVPVVYVTDGQRVPEDIHTASPGLLASIILPPVQTSDRGKV